MDEHDWLAERFQFVGIDLIADPERISELDLTVLGA